MRGIDVASHLGLLKARPRLAFVAAMLASIALSAVFYSVSSLLHPPSPFGQPGAPSTVGAWISAYSSWSQTNGDLGMGVRAGLVAAIAFGAAAIVVSWPRAAFVASFTLLNLFFAWSSGAFRGISASLELSMTQTIYNQDSYILSLLNLNVVTGDTYIIADLEALGFLAIVAAATLTINRRHGYPRAILYAVRMIAACFVILGAEIAVFDYKEFYMHATQTQSAFGWATWVSNADLLIAGVGVMAATWLVLRSGWKRPTESSR